MSPYPRCSSGLAASMPFSPRHQPRVPQKCLPPRRGPTSGRPPPPLIAPWCRWYWDCSATPLPMRRCRGRKHPRCDDPVVSQWGCKRARPAQHSANALQRLVSSVPHARGDVQPGGFVHRVGCSGCSDDDDCGRTRATPMCPYGADRAWEIDAARAAPLPAEGRFH